MIKEIREYIDHYLKRPRLQLYACLAEFRNSSQLAKVTDHSLFDD